MAKAKMKVTKKRTNKVKANTKTKAGIRKRKTDVPAGKKLKGFGRGYTVMLVNKTFNFGSGPCEYEVYELSGPKVGTPRIFVDEASVKIFIDYCDRNSVEEKALSGKSYGGVMARQVIKEHADLVAEKDLPELNTELADKCDKTSIEDIDA